MAPFTPAQVTLHTVADFLNSSDGPFHITLRAARALGALVSWNANLDSDDTEGNRLILAFAQAFDIEPSACDTATQQLTCLGCLIERHQGIRDTPNPAASIVGGQATCLEHLKLVDGPLIPGRTPGGIILGNGS